MAAKIRNDGNNDTVLQVAINKSATHNYEIIERHEAGLVLVGSEVKSIRGGGASLKEAYVQARSGELFLVNCHVAPYANSRIETYNPTRERKLLMHKHEIEKLGIALRQKGLTLIPLRMYLKKGRIKMEFGVARGKKLHDKREDLKKKEAQREVARALRHK